MDMGPRIQLLAILVTGGPVRASSSSSCGAGGCMERYALLWLFSTVVLLGLAVWRGLLEQVSAAVGIYYAPSALFAVAFGFVLVLLLHFSLVISRLADQNKVLAQRLGLLQHASTSSSAARPRPPSSSSAHDAHRDRLTALSLPRRRSPSSSSATTAPAHVAGDAGARCGRSSREDDELVRRRQRVARRHARRVRASRTARARPRARREPRLRRRLPRGRAARPPRRCSFFSTPTRCRRPGSSTRCAPPRRAPGLGRVAGARDAAGRRARSTRTATSCTGSASAGRAARRRRPRRRGPAAPHEVGFASGAALAVRREAWDAVGRLRRPATSCTARTSTCRCACGSRAGASASRRPREVEHDYEFAKGDYKWFWLERNRWWTVLGAYPGALLAALAPGAAGVRGRAAGRSRGAAAGCGRSCARRRRCCASCRRSCGAARAVQARRRVGAARVRRRADRLAGLAVPRGGPGDPGRGRRPGRVLAPGARDRALMRVGLDLLFLVPGRSGGRETYAASSRVPCVRRARTCTSPRS